MFSNSISKAYLPLSLLSLVARASSSNNSCRSIPGDTNWPTDAEWAQLNKSIDGQLIATVPLASICHTSPYNDFDETACASLQADWDVAETQ